ncbi:MAG TPA: HD domain-containing phosphohydrolase [Polyangia bacterium]|jgi:response regulator RpfG family c-di-GMP phosphodiesterase
MAASAAASRVLYVDDEPVLCRAFARLFHERGDVQVVTAGSPEDALGLLERERFDVVVSDLRMPGMSGLELLAAARRRAPETRRLLVSGYADFETALDAINEVGIDRLLTKPWQNEEVRAAVDGALQVARLQHENVRVTHELRRRTEELERINQRLDALVEERTSNLLDGLVSALDLRDSETQWHSRRVGRYARRLARELGIEGRELDDIERGATLHDIGKIGVRDAVLLKPGPLDDEEWVEMRRHPALGYDILKGIGFLERARLIPLHHQERFDGTGYPQGLRGEEICIGARVFAVVDTYDAITSDRPYRKCRTYEVARREIETCAGTQLDPTVVAQWLRITQAEWDAIREELEGAGAPQASGRKGSATFNAPA